MENPHALKHKELLPKELRWKCDPGIFDFDSTENIDPVEGIVGQERALDAIKLGVEIRSPGYNIYIAGLSGTGKATTVKKMLESISRNCPQLYDYAYVNNFKDGDRPLLLTFHAGKAKAFKHDYYAAIKMLQKKIPQTLDNESYLQKKQKIVDQFTEKEDAMMKGFEEKLTADNFSLGQVKVGEVARPEIFPIIDKKPVPIHQLDELIQAGKVTKEAAQDILKKYSASQQELQVVFRKALKINQDFQQKLYDIERDAVDHVVKAVIDNLKEKYNEEKITGYLSDVEKNVLENLKVFEGQKPEEVQTPEGYVIDYFKEYDVNIILDNSETTGCPVIVETSPSYTNLFGAIETIKEGNGNWYSDFTRIKAGSLLRANGGYLVVNIMHLLEEASVWRTLKRVLTFRQLEIQDLPNFYQYSQSVLKPEPIEIDAKVILIGSQQIYSYMSEYEYDFKKIFKVKADFDYEVKRSDEIIEEYARVIKKLIKEEGLREFDKSAIAYMMEIAAIFAGSKNKLTSKFSKLADIVREANYRANQDGAKTISDQHVKRAYEGVKERHGMLESKVSDMITNEMIMIDTQGKRVGQVNGLAVYNADFYSFGRPTRITASVSLGSGNILNVEREAGMGGRTYNKGVLIISGYFRETFGQDMPLSFNANLVFEQSYGMVDGDSASCAEIFALLSTLSDLPLKQSIAVTGSLNQKGDVQPIGDVNEKIEGFYDVCKQKGLHKGNGVIIPAQNVQELMLREDVIESVRDKEFHIYPIERIEEGIEILTGVKSGKKLHKGYEPGTVYALVAHRINELYKKNKQIKTNNTNPKPNGADAKTDGSNAKAEKSDSKTDKSNSKTKKKKKK
jgi:lon-related putative ATP-dependent protease